MREDKVAHRRLESGMLLQFVVVIWVREAADIEDKVSLGSRAVLESERHAGDEHLVQRAGLDNSGNLFLELSGRELCRVDDVVGSEPCVVEHLPLALQRFGHRDSLGGDQRMRSPRELVPADYHLVGTFHEYRPTVEIL